MTMRYTNRRILYFTLSSVHTVKLNVTKLASSVQFISGDRNGLLNDTTCASLLHQAEPTRLQIITLTESSGKRNVTVWRPYVRPSVCLSRRYTHRDSPGGSIPLSQPTFRLTIRRTDVDILVLMDTLYQHDI